MVFIFALSYSAKVFSDVFQKKHQNLNQKSMRLGGLKVVN